MNYCDTSATFGARMSQVSPLRSGRYPRDRFGLSMRIRETGTSPLGVLPPELLKEIFQQYVHIERARYLEQIGAPRGEYSIRDYIWEYGQPDLSDNILDLTGKDLTSLGGLELIDNPDQIKSIYLDDNYFSTYYDPYLDPYVYYVVHDMTHRGSIEPFRRFSKLLVLYLRKNQFTTLPEGLFANLQKLAVLSLINNQLITLPPGLFKDLQSLMDLYLENNQLTVLPSGVFEGLQSLDFLTLRNNHIPGTQEEFIATHTILRNVRDLQFYPQKPETSVFYS